MYLVGLMQICFLFDFFLFWFIRVWLYFLPWADVVRFELVRVCSDLGRFGLWCGVARPARWSGLSIHLFG